MHVSAEAEERTVPDRCGFCGEPWKGKLQTFWIAELCCLMCGDATGSLESDTWPPRSGLATLHRVGQPSVRTHRLPTCPRCGGWVFIDQLTQGRRLLGPPNNTLFDHPHRGRPTLAQVARRREQAEAERLRILRLEDSA